MYTYPEPFTISSGLWELTYCINSLKGLILVLKKDKKIATKAIITAVKQSASTIRALPAYSLLPSSEI